MTDLTKITTPFGLLDRETQEALKAHGGPYEAWHESAVWWTVLPGWRLEQTYRVKPQPRQPREFMIAIHHDGTQTVMEEGALYKEVNETVRVIEWPENAPLPSWTECEE